MKLPSYDKKRKNESMSYAIVVYYLRDIGIFRNVTEHDFGIDFEIEIVRKGKVTGRVVKVQVKSSEKLRTRKKDGIRTVSGIKQSTLLYWTEICQHTNVLVLAVDLKTEKIYMTGPIFTKASQLLDEGQGSKTIEFLPTKDFDDWDAKNHNHVIAATLCAFTYLEPQREKLSLHRIALRELTSYLHFYHSVNSHDAGCSVGDPDFFQGFLETSLGLLGSSPVGVESFNNEEQKNWWKASYWNQNSNPDGPCNYECQKACEILMPALLGKLTKLRLDIMAAPYYWFNVNPNFLECVVSILIPTARSHEEIMNLSESDDILQAQDGGVDWWKYYREHAP